MKVKKIVALLASAAMVGATAMAGSVAAASTQNLQVPQLQIDKTKVVLPTIPEVNGVPLNIKADAATAVSLVEDIYSKTIYSALETFQKSLVPVYADKQVSNYVTDNDQVVTLETDGTLSDIVFGTVIYDTTGNPTGVDVNGDGTQDYALIQDTSGQWYVDFNADGTVDTGDIPVKLVNGLALRANFSNNGPAADVDLDDHFYIAQLDVPFATSLDQLYDANGNPVDKVYFAIDFSKIKYIDPNATDLSALEKAHVGEWELDSGAIILAYPLKYSPLKPSADDIVIPSTITLEDGTTINVLYYYQHYYPGDDPNKEVQVDVGSPLNVDNWTFLVDDISTDGTSAYVYITGPNGQKDEVIVPISSSYMVVAWIDSDGQLQYEIDDTTTALQKVGQLWADGIKSVATFAVTDKFIGIDNKQVVTVNADVYELKNTYKDGEKLSEIIPQFKNIPDANNWYLKINVDNANETIVEFVFEADNTGTGTYPPAFVQPGEKVVIPLLYFKEVTVTVNGQTETEYQLDAQQIDLTLSAEKNDDGYWDPTTAKFYVYYMKNLDQYYKASMVNDDLQLTMKKIENYNPSDAIMTDQDLLKDGFQPGYDYIIIGGWVSNAAWKLLEKYYPDQVKDMKEQLLNDISQGKPGFVLKVLPNPADPNCVVIVAAGTDHEQTRAAVQALMELLNSSSAEASSS